jgi:hypothetical protein
MKDFIINLIKAILEFIKKLFKIKEKIEIPINEETTEDEEEETEEVIDEVVEETPDEEPVIEPPVVEVPIEEPKYVLLSPTEYQTQLKVLGLYTKNIDGIVGDGTKKAIKQFNKIFLNSDTEEYTESTDKLLRTIYESYRINPNMKDSDWQYFKNFKKTEYKCKCGGKYCNGYPSEISIRLVMADQYTRNVYGKSVNISSGLRCAIHNKNVGGAVDSVHPKGQASDSGITGVVASKLRATAKELPFVYYSYDITSKYVHKSVNL